jgi:hypothetical protein
VLALDSKAAIEDPFFNFTALLIDLGEIEVSLCQVGFQHTNVDTTVDSAIEYIFSQFLGFE